MHLIELPDHIADELDSLPIAARTGKFERAIHRALDNEGWPQGERGAIAVPANYYYVTIWRRDGSLRGHVGPIHGMEAARRCLASWKLTGVKARINRMPVGESLTNAAAIGTAP